MNQHPTKTFFNLLSILLLNFILFFKIHPHHLNLNLVFQKTWFREVIFTSSRYYHLEIMEIYFPSPDGSCMYSHATRHGTSNRDKHEMQGRSFSLLGFVEKQMIMEVRSAKKQHNTEKNANRRYKNRCTEQFVLLCWTI